MRLKKLLSRSLQIVIGVFMIFSVSACKKTENEIKIWSTYNTLKVMQSYGEYPDLGVRLDVFMAKAETEGAQLIVTPERDVKNVTLIASDLKKADGTVFKKEDITVYFQKYIKVNFKTTGQTNYKYPAGYTPDLMLPMETAAAFGENHVKGGQNQGFTVEFKTAADTPEGVYTGSFALEADGERFDIPVSLKVYDIDLTGANGMTSIRALSTKYMNGEYNNTPEMYRRYYETSMNDYKFMLDRLPGSTDPDQMAQSAVDYWDNPNFTSFAIPTQGYDSAHASDNKMLVRGELYSYMYALAQQSAPGRILFDKAYMYPLHLDEPKLETYDAVRANTAAIYEIEDIIFADLEKEGYFDNFEADYKQAFKQSITTIPVVITANRTQLASLGSDINTYCTQIDQYDTAAMREQYQRVQEETASRGGQKWFYTCMEPIYPYPSHHIDDNLLGARVMRWMQKDYDLTGYLHWSFNSYHIWTGSETLNCDPYEEASRFSNEYADTVGDGFMFYPGKKYGIDTYLPSIRLTTFRDGQEDYDALCVLDKLIAEKEKYFNIPSGTVDAKIYTQDLFKSLYTGTVYNESDAALYSARRSLFETVEKHRSDTRFLVNSTIENGKAISNIYLAGDYALSVNGEPLKPSSSSGQGVKYTVIQSLTDGASLDIVISKNNKTVETHQIFVAARTVAIDLNETVSPLYVSDTGEISYGDNAAEITLKSKGGTLNEMLTFVPSVGINPNAFSFGLDKIDTITLTIENKLETELELRFRLKAGYSTYDLGLYTFKVGETKTVSIKEIYNYASVFEKLSSATIEIYADNIDKNNNLLGDKRFILSNISYSVKGERQ